MQHVSSINVVELLKHDYVIMPMETVRWIELVFGEGLSAEEASQKIAEQLDEEVAATEQSEDEMPEKPDESRGELAETEAANRR